MIRSLLIVFVLAFTLLGVEEAYSQKCFNLVGQTTGIIPDGNPCGSVLEENGCLEGVTSGVNPLTVSVTLTSFAPAPQGPGNVGVFAGDTVITTQGGAQIFGKDNGAINLGGRSADLLTFTGGTGFFTGAFGEAVLDTQSDLENKTFVTNYRGFVCRPIP